jgi:hypothetical protein
MDKRMFENSCANKEAERRLEAQSEQGEQDRCVVHRGCINVFPEE